MCSTFPITPTGADFDLDFSMWNEISFPFFACRIESLHGHTKCVSTHSVSLRNGRTLEYDSASSYVTTHIEPLSRKDDPISYIEINNLFLDIHNFARLEKCWDLTGCAPSVSGRPEAEVGAALITGGTSEIDDEGRRTFNDSFGCKTS